MPEQKVHATSVAELPIEYLEVPEMIQMLEIWNDWRAERPAPMWHDVNLMKIPRPLLSTTSVVDVLYGGEDFYYRYWGVGLTNLFGLDRTGVRMSEHPIIASHQVRNKQLDAVIEGRCPKLFLATIERPDFGTVAHKINLRLPIMDNPDEVTKILSMCEVDRINMEGSEDLAWYYPYEYVDA